MSASLYRRRTGLADEVRSDAIPDAAGGEGGHGAARPDRVIHRYVRRQRSKVTDPPTLPKRHQNAT